MESMQNVANPDDIRVQRIGDVWAVDERVPCPCPDCRNPQHGAWERRGGSMTQRGAEAIAERMRERRGANPK